MTGSSRMTAEVVLLGPLEARAGGRTLNVGTGKRRALLALLALDANRVVTVDRLQEELWHGRPPPTASAALQNSVAQLRAVLEPERARGAAPRVLMTHPSGYELRLAPLALDAQRFERLLADAAEASAARRPERAVERLRRALEIWRGPALADLRDEPFAAPAAARLEALRVEAVEQRIAAELALGAGSDLVPELQRLVAEEPLRERLRAQLMLALYRAGRQADALAAYQAARRTLVEELGLEPGPELRRLERDILAHDPALLAPVESGRVRIDAPAPATPIVGRGRELAEVAALVERHRLVTLTGFGGTGKTRLALEVLTQTGPRLGGGVFVDLSALTDAEQVLGRIADRLEIAETLDAPALAARLAARELLLVLDNCEQVLAAAPDVGALLAGAPGLRVLATSREALRLAAEHEYPVPPLSAGDAVALFMARSRARDPHFELADAGVVEEICARLDGLPLAIELASAWSRVLSPGQLLARLGRRLDLLAHGATDVPARQRTLRATIEWSERLLEDEARAVLAGLATFRGWTVDAAEQVAGPAALEAQAALAAASLIRRVAGEEPRFKMLELVREYALERLDASGAAQDAHRRHARWALEFAERHETALIGAEQDRWLRRFDEEHDNLRAALEWAVEHDPQLGLALAGDMRRYWYARGLFPEGRRWYERVLSVAPADPQAPLPRAKALYGQGVFLYYDGAPDAAQAAWEEALTLYHAAADAEGTANALNTLAMLAQYRGETATAERLYRDALATARPAGRERPQAVTLSNLGRLAHERGDYAEARALLEDALARFRDQRDERSVGDQLNCLGAVATAQGDHERAEALIQEALTLFRRLRDATGVVESLQSLAATTAARGQPEQARELLDEALERSRATGDAWGQAITLDQLAQLSLAERDDRGAVRFAREALGLHERLQYARGIELATFVMAQVEAAAAQR